MSLLEGLRVLSEGVEKKYENLGKWGLVFRK